MQARTLHDMDSVEDTAIVVADVDRGGGRRLPTTVMAALITATHLGERPATTA